MWPPVLVFVASSKRSDALRYISRKWTSPRKVDSKGVSAPDQWKPPRTGYWCTYATDWTQVKKTWDLTATQSEYDALAQMLQTC